MKIKTFFIIIALLAVSCGTSKEDMIKIKDYIIHCSSDLTRLEINKGIKMKDFNLEDNKFTMLIDTTGKPVFLLDKIISKSIILNYHQHKYKVIINKAEVKVCPVD